MQKAEEEMNDSPLCLLDAAVRLLYAIAVAWKNISPWMPVKNYSSMVLAQKILLLPSRWCLELHALPWHILRDLQFLFKGRIFSVAHFWSAEVVQRGRPQTTEGNLAALLRCILVTAAQGTQVKLSGSGSRYFPLYNAWSFHLFLHPNQIFSLCSIQKGKEKARIITAKSSFTFQVRHQSSMLAGFKESLGNCRNTAGLLTK